MSLVLQSSGGGQITIQEPATASNFTQTLPAADGTVLLTDVAGTLALSATGSNVITASTNGTERMRIDGSGNVLVNTTTTGFGRFSSNTGGTGVAIGARFTAGGGNSVGIATYYQNTTGTAVNAFFAYNGNIVGQINSDASTTAYITSSDYRLKENIAPMTGALAKVALLKPCTYTWKSSGKQDQGFIAHELAEVCPSAVAGEKDAVNEDGSIKAQGIDTSFLVATLTAAIQELNAKLDAQALEIQALKGVA